MENNSSFQSLDSEVLRGARHSSVKLLLEIEADVIGFLDRDSLDVYQLVSRDQREVVGRYSDALSLREITDFYVLKCEEVNGEVTFRCGCRKDTGFCVVLKGRRRYHISSSLCTEEDAYREVSLRLRNGFVCMMEVMYPTLCRVVRNLHRNFSATDNYHLKGLFLAGDVVPSSELLSFAFDKLNASVLYPGGSVDHGWLAAQSRWLKPLLVKLQTLVICPLLNTLRRDLEMILSWCDSNMRVICVNWAVDSGSWVNEYIQSFVEADVTKRFISAIEVQILVANADIVTPAPVPSRCSAPVVEHKARTVETFRSPLAMQDAECALYVFDNLARKEALRVYVASALFDTTIDSRDGGEYRCHCHAYCLQIQPSKAENE